MKNVLIKIKKFFEFMAPILACILSAIKIYTTIAEEKREKERHFWKMYWNNQEMNNNYNNGKTITNMGA